MRTRQPLIVDVYRGPFVESSHQVIASFHDGRGVHMGYIGNYDMPTYPRSCIKMLQAIPFLESGAYEAFHLTQEHIALACSSHDGSEQHTKKILEWMTKVGIKEENLACGSHDPLNKTAADQLRMQKKSPTALHNNCSGKHTAMLTTAIHKGESLDGYHLQNHPVQMRITKLLEELTKQPLAKTSHGIDGCGIPTYCAPLQAWSMALASVLTAQPTAGALRAKVHQVLLESLRRYPVLVSGEGSLCHQISKATDGNVFIKSGAEGAFSGFFFNTNIAFCMKVLDGAHRAVPVALGAFMKEYAQLTDKQLQSLKPILEPEIKNARGEVVGQLRLRAS